MKQQRVETTGARQTQALAARLAGHLRGGDILALSGDLGAGKTTFTQGLATGLGVTAVITSPTFVLIHRYRLPAGGWLQHADCYRLADAPLEMWDAGLGDLFGGDDIVVVEWAERIPGLLPLEHLEIRFTYVDEARRLIEFTGHGPRLAALVAELEL